jgi:hypothetical protein
MADALNFETGPDDAIRSRIDGSGWLSEPVVAAGQLRQGKAPSTVAMMTGVALIEVLRPRRSKLLPRHFVLAATEDKVVAFKASGGGSEDDGPYNIRIQPEIEATFERSAVRLTDLDEGRSSKGGTLEVNGERIPVARPNLSGDPSTDALFELLSA